MQSSDVEGAIRSVLPALNLRPDQFHLEAGFLDRAQRRGKPVAIALGGVSKQAMYVGYRESRGSEAEATNLAADAFTCLSAASRSVCEQLIVAWAAPDGHVLAAAFGVSATGGVGTLLASSWMPPDSWPQPMFDALIPASDAFAAANERLVKSVRDRGAFPHAKNEIERSLLLINNVLRRYGGEGPAASTHPAPDESDERWKAWLERYTSIVRDEWMRVGGAERRFAGKVVEPVTNGPLSGMSVFLSYARPDAATLAWPVYEALSSSGASVWFDLDQAPPSDAAWLSHGLAEAIAGCSAYVMCASNEFVERAGYAMQELAWAIQHQGSGGRTTHFIVVAESNTILPTLVADWPRVELTAAERTQLSTVLTTHLLTTPNVFASSAKTPALSTPLDAEPRPSPVADTLVMRDRIRHLRRFDEIDQNAVSELAASGDRDRRVAAVRQRLLNVGEGLDWPGTLVDIDRWPEDSFVRGIRWRLATARALAGTRWPLSGELESGPRITDDVKYLATEQVPILQWPTVVGWGDNERRLGLRYHIGLLRLLHELLQRGLVGGLLDVPMAKLDGWERALLTRRRECYDATLTLRMEGELSWRGEPPTWDGLFRSWSRLLGEPPDDWRSAVPGGVRQALTANAAVVAAIGAQTCWWVAKHGSAALQSTTVLGPGGPISIDVFAVGCEPERDDLQPESELRVGLIAKADGGANLTLSWPDGSWSGEAIEDLSYAVNFCRA